MPTYKFTSKHVRFKALVRRVGRKAAVYHLHELEAYLVDYAPDGDLEAMSDEDIEAASEWDGDAGQWVEALQETGLLTESRQVRGWPDCAPDFVKRKLRRRGRTGPATDTETDDGTQTKNLEQKTPTIDRQLAVNGHQTSVSDRPERRGEEKRGVEKRREEKTTTPTTPQPPLAVNGRLERLEAEAEEAAAISFLESQGFTSPTAMTRFARKGVRRCHAAVALAKARQPDRPVDYAVQVLESGGRFAEQAEAELVRVSAASRETFAGWMSNPSNAPDAHREVVLLAVRFGKLSETEQIQILESARNHGRRTGWYGPAEDFRPPFWTEEIAQAFRDAAEAAGLAVANF